MQDDRNAIFQMRFPQKLWYLLSLRTEAILWGGTGRTILLNYRVLHNYLQCDHSVFKTTNISSFVRQLNLYGFRKVTSHLQDPLCNSSNPYMHEYVHDYFQYGRPELLDKITRKVLTMKKNVKTKSLFNGSEHSIYMTPLQKARRALRIALKKAAQDFYIQHSAKPPSDLKYEYDDTPEDYCEEDDNIELNWFMPKTEYKDTENKEHETDDQQSTSNNVTKESNDFDETSQDDLINFNGGLNRQSSDNFSTQFFGMPELDSISPEENSGVELLAEFNIDNDMDQGITRKINGNKSDHSLNCVLPSVSNDQNDDVSIVEKNLDDTSSYHGEWDLMFNDMVNKSSSQEVGSDLKELYSQISKTIDLLNS